MICHHALTEREQLLSQKIYIESTCCGTMAALGCNFTIQVLLAIHLGLGETLVSSLGALEYLKYVLLPFGFYFAGRFGVARSMRGYNAAVTGTCIAFLFSCLCPKSFPQALPLVFFFLGMLLFFTATALNTAMLFPLQKNITTDQTLASFIARNQAASAATGLVTNLVIAGIFAVFANSTALPLLFVSAGILYFFNALLIGKIPEPEILKEIASRPLFAQVKAAWSDPLVRKILIVGMIQNLVFVTMLPVNLLASKLGCRMENAKVIILTTVQCATLLLATWCYKHFTERFGPRKMMIVTCPVVWLMAAYWVLVPVEKSFFLLLVPFMLSSFLTTGFASAMGNYAIMAIPNNLQVGGSFLIFLFHGGLVGLIGVFANPALFKILSPFADAGDPMKLYRAYFLITGFLSLPVIFAFLSLPVKYLEYRERNRNSAP